MIRLLPFVIELALIIFCLIDVIQTPEDGVRNLPKWGWIVLIIIVPLIGSVAWLVAGRPQRPRTAGWRYGAGFPEAERPVGGAQALDAQLEQDLARVDREHEEMLRRWQADLERREGEHGGGDAPTGTDPG